MLYGTVAVSGLSSSRNLAFGKSFHLNMSLCQQISAAFKMLVDHFQILWLLVVYFELHLVLTKLFRTQTSSVDALARQLLWVVFGWMQFGTGMKSGLNRAFAKGSASPVLFYHFAGINLLLKISCEWRGHHLS